MFKLLVHNLVLLETIDSKPVPRGTIRNIRSPYIMLQVSLMGKHSGKEISARALINSGTEGMIINSSFASKHKLMLQQLKTPLPVCNVDGSMNKAGAVLFTMIQTIWILAPWNQYHKECSEFYVITIGDHDIILGTDWLKAHNSEVNWTMTHLTFMWYPKTCILSERPLIIWPITTMQPATVISTLELYTMPPDPIYNTLATMPFIAMQQLFKYYEPLAIQAKTIHSTNLAVQMKGPNLDQIWTISLHNSVSIIVYSVNKHQNACPSTNHGTMLLTSSPILLWKNVAFLALPLQKWMPWKSTLKTISVKDTSTLSSLLSPALSFLLARRMANYNLFKTIVPSMILWLKTLHHYH